MVDEHVNSLPPKDDQRIAEEDTGEKLDLAPEEQSAETEPLPNFPTPGYEDVQDIRVGDNKLATYPPLEIQRTINKLPSLSQPGRPPEQPSLTYFFIKAIEILSQLALPSAPAPPGSSELSFSSSSWLLPGASALSHAGGPIIAKFAQPHPTIRNLWIEQGTAENSFTYHLPFDLDKLFPHTSRLIKEGRLPLNSPDQEGNTFLMHLIKEGADKIDWIHWFNTDKNLVNYDFFAKNSLGETTLEVAKKTAIHSTDLIEMIAFRTITLGVTTGNIAELDALFEKNILHQEDLIFALKLPVRHQLKSQQSMTLLTFAIQERDLRTVEYLLSKGADPAQLVEGINALELAAEQGDPDIIDVLCAHAPSLINKISAAGTTPLIRAAKRGHTKAFTTLLTKYKADPRLGETPSYMQPILLMTIRDNDLTYSTVDVFSSIARVNYNSDRLALEQAEFALSICKEKWGEDYPICQSLIESIKIKNSYIELEFCKQALKVIFLLITGIGGIIYYRNDKKQPATTVQEKKGSRDLSDQLEKLRKSYNQLLKRLKNITEKLHTLAVLKQNPDYKKIQATLLNLKTRAEETQKEISQVEISSGDVLADGIMRITTNLEAINGQANELESELPQIFLYLKQLAHLYVAEEVITRQKRSLTSLVKEEETHGKLIEDQLKKLKNIDTQRKQLPDKKRAASENTLRRPQSSKKSTESEQENFKEQLKKLNKTELNIILKKTKKRGFICKEKLLQLSTTAGRCQQLLDEKYPAPGRIAQQHSQLLATLADTRVAYLTIKKESLRKKMVIEKFIKNVNRLNGMLNDILGVNGEDNNSNTLYGCLNALIQTTENPSGARKLEEFHPYRTPKDSIVSLEGVLNELTVDLLRLPYSDMVAKRDRLVAGIRRIFDTIQGSHTLSELLKRIGATSADKNNLGSKFEAQKKKLQIQTPEELLPIKGFLRDIRIINQQLQPIEEELAILQDEDLTKGSNHIIKILDDCLSEKVSTLSSLPGEVPAPSSASPIERPSLPPIKRHDPRFFEGADDSRELKKMAPGIRRRGSSHSKFFEPELGPFIISTAVATPVDSKENLREFKPGEI